MGKLHNQKDCRPFFRTQNAPFCLKVRVCAFKPSPQVMSRNKLLFGRRRARASGETGARMKHVSLLVSAQHVLHVVPQGKHELGGLFRKRKRQCLESLLFFRSTQSHVIVQRGPRPRQETRKSLSIAVWGFVLTWRLRRGAVRGFANCPADLMVDHSDQQGLVTTVCLDSWRINVSRRTSTSKKITHQAVLMVAFYIRAYLLCKVINWFLIDYLIQTDYL